MSTPIQLHHDADEFIAAITYTAGITGFRTELIEKDYFCSLILNYLFDKHQTPLVFKGGTLLSKVYSEFYRLSEDLDLTLSISPMASRNERRNKAMPFKNLVNSIADVFEVFWLESELKGFNESKQYNATIGYHSFTSKLPGRISVEISLRELLLVEPVNGMAKTLLFDPFSGSSAIKPISVKCMTLKEAYSEKMRAAFLRDEPAIRDFFDIDFALQNKLISIDDHELESLFKKKLIVEQKKNLEISNQRYILLNEQIDSELKPTLRETEHDTFSLERVVKILQDFSHKLSDELIAM